jgi:hypothetical protein
MHGFVTCELEIDKNDDVKDSKKLQIIIVHSPTAFGNEERNNYAGAQLRVAYHQCVKRFSYTFCIIHE